MAKKILVILFLLYKVSNVYAVENVSGSSAQISSNIDSDKASTASALFEQTKKKYVVSRVLEKYNSPLVGAVDTFIDTCSRYNFNCYLLPSIAGLESRFGWYTYPGSNNPFGWGGGYIMFSSWSEAIQTVGEGLATRYIGQGATTVDQIGPMYAESPTWAYRVKGFMNEFENEEKQMALTQENSSLSL